MARVVLLILTLVLAVVARSFPAEDGTPGRRVLESEIRGAFTQGNYAEVEARARDFAVKKLRMKDGWWKLSVWMDAVNDPVDRKSAEGWAQHLRLIDRWLTVSASESSLALTAKGASLVGYAWFARGGGFASTVTDDGWRLFEDRLSEARRTLERVPPAKRLPVWYTSMQMVALGQGWPKRDYEALFIRAVALESDFYEFYLNKVYFLLPRWHGEDGEWQAFANAMLRERGTEMYTRICWGAGDTEGIPKLFTAYGINWAVMKKGFEDMRRHWPDSMLVRLAYCRVAYAAKDRKTASELFSESGMEYIDGSWSRANFEQARRWALELSQQPNSGPSPKTEAPAPNVVPKFEIQPSTVPKPEPTPTPKRPKVY